MKLNLHRVGREPDWAAVPEADWNVWQRLGAATRGFVTPGNVVTVLGFVLCMWGVGALIAGQTWMAILLLAVGRLLDVFDGSVAHVTGTKSHVGEILDAMVDKIILGVTIVGMFLAHVAPSWLLGLFLLPHVVIVVITFIDRARGVEIHPTRLGKTTTLLAWVAVPLLLVERAVGAGIPDWLHSLITIYVVVCAAFGFITAQSYLTHPEK